MLYQHRRIAQSRAMQGGFTLLELLVVLSILAVVAGLGVQALGLVGKQNQATLLRAEMSNIAKAISRFHADTGYWPKEGPFEHDTSTLNPLHPANLAQLRIAPNDGTDILSYDIASGSGWHGPYISELDAVTVSVGSGLGAGGSGSPIAGVAQVVSGIGDPFNRAPNGNYFIWSNASGDEFERLGRPFLYFIVGVDVDGNGVHDNIPACQVPCLVSLGTNGDYENGGGDDIVINIAGH